MIITKKISLFFVLLLGLLVSCGKDGQSSVALLEAKTSSLKFSSWSGTRTIVIEANVDYEVYSSENWCKAEKGNGSIKISVEENLDTDDRNAQLTLVATGAPQVIIDIQQTGQGSVEDDSYSLIVCGQRKVYIIDEATSNGTDVNIKWSLDIADLKGKIPATHLAYMGTLDECKVVDNGTKLLLSSSNSGGILLIDIATKEPLFYSGLAPNAHSADLLPNGKIAAVLSTNDKGNKIVVYDINKSETVLFEQELYGGHGVVWMAERNRLYALGSRVLREYSLKNWSTSQPELVKEKEWNLPAGGGHDLSPYNNNTLMVASDLVYSFDITSGKFTEFEPLKGMKEVKSINYLEESNWIVYTKAEESYWTENVYMINPTKKITFPNHRLYKVRLMKNQ